MHLLNENCKSVEINLISLFLVMYAYAFIIKVKIDTQMFYFHIFSLCTLIQNVLLVLTKYSIEFYFLDLKH